MCYVCDGFMSDKKDVRGSTYTIEVDGGRVTIDFGPFQLEMDPWTARSFGEEVFRRGCEAAQVSDLRGDDSCG